MNKWENYGDENPIEHGGFWIFKDKDFEDSYYVLVLDKDPDSDKFILKDLYVEINDDWIEWESIANYLGVSLEEMSDIDKVRGAVDYHNYLNFGELEIFDTKEEVIDVLFDNGITI